MNYKVTKQYLRGGETAIAEFQDLDDAKLFIREKLSADVTLNVKIIYRINELGETIVEFQPGDISASSNSGASSSSKSSTFRPTPLNTAPRPSGTPQKWVKDEDQDENK